MAKQKKSSSVSAKQMMQALTEMGYVSAHFSEKADRTPKCSVRDEHDKAYRNANNAGIPEVSRSAISNSGSSIHLIFKGETSGRHTPAQELFVPAKGMLSQGQLKAICEKTGLDFD